MMLRPVIRYGAERSTELTESEAGAVDRIIEKYAVVQQVDADPAEGPNWEEFDRDAPEKLKGSGLILRGAMWLPDNSREHMWKGLVHWCKVLTEIRRALEDASWYVNVDDSAVEWDEATKEYVPDPYAEFLVANPFEVASEFATKLSDAGFLLDFTVASLHGEVDKVIRSDFMPEDLRQAFAPRRPLSLVKFVKSLWERTFGRVDLKQSTREKRRNEAALAAYIGEVIRRNRGGQWTGIFHPNCPFLNMNHSLVVFDDEIAPFRPAFWLNAVRENGASFQDIMTIALKDYTTARRASS